MALLCRSWMSERLEQLLQPTSFTFHSCGRNLGPLCFYFISLSSSTKCTQQCVMRVKTTYSGNLKSVPLP